MKLYHGSYIAVEKPDLKFSRKRMDFGKGFYVTPIKSQAKHWAKRFLKNNGSAVVSTYNFTLDANNIKTLQFTEHNTKWLRFIVACRKGKPVDTEWDLIVGGVANDKVFNTIQLFWNDIIGEREAIKRLRFNKPNIQYCFKKQALVDNYLLFIKSEDVK